MKKSLVLLSSLVLVGVSTTHIHAEEVNQPETEVPVVPTAPTITETPAEPVAPPTDTPKENTEIQSTPEQPETPVVPDTPNVPEVPKESETPATPDVPNKPETPEVPTEPSTPTPPENPEEPKQPENPDTPKVPDTPKEEPNVPNIPEIPSSPEIRQDTTEQSTDMTIAPPQDKESSESIDVAQGVESDTESVADEKVEQATLPKTSTKSFVLEIVSGISTLLTSVFVFRKKDNHKIFSKSH